MSQPRYSEAIPNNLTAEYTSPRGVRILGMLSTSGNQAILDFIERNTELDVSGVGPVTWAFDGERHNATALAVRSVVGAAARELHYPECDGLLFSTDTNGTPTSTLVLASSTFSSGEFDRPAQAIVDLTNERLALLGDLCLPVPRPE